MTEDERWATPAWMQFALEALRDSFQVEPTLRGKMIDFLFDEGFWDRGKVSWDNAVTRFNACLNPSTANFFKFSEIWALMGRFGRHQLFLAMAEDLGYETPRLRSTEERHQQLIAALGAQLRESNAIAQRALEVISRSRPARPSRLHPSIAEGTAHFSMPRADKTAGTNVPKLSFFGRWIRRANTRGWF